MNFSVLILPFLFLILFVYARFRGVKLYDAFTEGGKKALSLTLSLFPCLAAIFIMTELFEASGLSLIITKLLTPLFNILGIPAELGKLVLIKPFSGSGSLAILAEVFSDHGADSYISRCASVIFGSSETVFYISAIYFAGCKNKKLLLPIIISLFTSIFAAALACFIIRIGL